MNDAFLQILLLLAYLAIGLISVIFPIYAISVNYLPSEKWESEKETKKRINKLKDIVEELNKELSGEREDSERFLEIGRRIEQYQSEKKNLELRVRYLTAEGAVKIPIIGLSIALLTSGGGIYFFYQGNELGAIAGGICAGILIALVIRNLYKTISAIELSALRPARTMEYEVCFGSGEKTLEIKRGTKARIEVGARPEGDVQDFKLWVGIPKEIELKGITSTNATLVAQAPKATFPAPVAVVAEEPSLSKHVFAAVAFEVLVEKTGKYILPIGIFAKGIYLFETELLLIVLD